MRICFSGNGVRLAVLYVTLQGPGVCRRMHDACPTLDAKLSFLTELKKSGEAPKENSGSERTYSSSERKPNGSERKNDGSERKCNGSEKRQSGSEKV